MRFPVTLISLLILGILQQGKCQKALWERYIEPGFINQIVPKQDLSRTYLMSFMKQADCNQEAFIYEYDLESGFKKQLFHEKSCGYSSYGCSDYNFDYLITGLKEFGSDGFHFRLKEKRPRDTFWWNNGSGSVTVFNGLFFSYHDVDRRGIDNSFLDYNQFIKVKGGYVYRLGTKNHDYNYQERYRGSEFRLFKTPLDSVRISTGYFPRYSMPNMEEVFADSARNQFIERSAFFTEFSYVIVGRKEKNRFISNTLDLKIIDHKTGKYQPSLLSDVNSWYKPSHVRIDQDWFEEITPSTAKHYLLIADTNQSWKERSNTLIINTLEIENARIISSDTIRWDTGFEFKRIKYHDKQAWLLLHDGYSSKLQVFDTYYDLIWEREFIDFYFWETRDLAFLDSSYVVAGKRNKLGYLAAYAYPELIQNQPAANFSFVFYPNPVSDRLFIESSSQKGKVSIYNQNGSIVLTRELFNYRDWIDTRILKPGTYVIEFKSNEAVLTKKLVKFSE